MIFNDFQDKKLSLLGFGTMRLPVNAEGIIDEAWLKEAGITPVYPEKCEQKLIMSLIYDYVKAGKIFTALDQIHAMVEHLRAQGAQGLILGCTELPIAFAPWQMPIPTFDPTLILAKAAIREAGYQAK